MKDKYAKDIIDKINRRYNGKILEIKDKQGLISSWAAELNNYILLFTDYENFYEFQSNNEINEMQKSGYKIVPVYLEDNIEIGKLLSNSVIINCNDKKVFYGDEAVKNIADILTGCIVQEKKNQRYLSPITFIIIGLNIIAYIITAYLSNNLIDSNIYVLVALGAKYNPLIKSGEYYRLLTCGFLHGGIIHLVLNMTALYQVGPIAERYLGKLKYAAVYLISLLLSSYLSYLLSDSISIGASGAVFGILGALLIIGLLNRRKISKDFIKSIINVIVINLIIGFTIPNIDSSGHIGGLIGGVISTAIFLKFKKEA